MDTVDVVLFHFVTVQDRGQYSKLYKQKKQLY